jgi:hypothetical protein
MKFFTIFDSISEKYGSPILLDNVKVFVRMVDNHFKDPKNAHLHFDDYRFYEIGDYDADTAMISGHNLKEIPVEFFEGVK